MPIQSELCGATASGSVTTPAPPSTSRKNSRSDGSTCAYGEAAPAVPVAQRRGAASALLTAVAAGAALPIGMFPANTAPAARPLKRWPAAVAALAARIPNSMAARSQAAHAILQSQSQRDTAPRASRVSPRRTRSTEITQTRVSICSVITGSRQKGCTSACAPPQCASTPRLLWRTEAAPVMDPALLVADAEGDPCGPSTFVALRLLSGVDVHGLRRAAAVLTARHAVLRPSAFAGAAAAADGAAPGEPVDFAEISVPQGEDLAAWVAAEAVRPWVARAGDAPDLHVATHASEPDAPPAATFLRVRVVVSPPPEDGPGEADAEGAVRVLLLAAPRPLVDSSSMLLLLDELQVLYTTRATDALVALPAVDWDFLQYSAFQEEMLRGGAGDQGWAFWQRTLADAPSMFPVTTDRPRPPNHTFDCGSHGFSLSADLVDRLRAFCRALSVDLFSFLLGAWSVYLSRTSGQHDFLVACPILVRDESEIANSVGNFTNVVPIRADMGEDPTFRDFLESQGNAVSAARAHARFPYRLLCQRVSRSGGDAGGVFDVDSPAGVGSSGGAGDGPSARRSFEPIQGRAPLCQVAFVYERVERSALDGLAPAMIAERGSPASLGGLLVEPVAVPKTASGFDLSLLAADSTAGITLSLRYNAHLFEPATMERMQAGIEQLLHSILDSDGAPKLSDLNILPDAERHLVMVEWNNTAAPYPADAVVHQLVEQQVLRTPDAAAWRLGDRVVSYQELNERANRLAHFLRFVGVGLESLVPVILPRGLELVVAWLGILKAGGVVMPLDPKFPEEAIAHMMGDADARVVLTEEALCTKVPPLERGGARVVCIDRDWAQIEEGSATNPVNLTSPRHLAYTIFTSGSTGRPKGVMLEHRGLVNYITWHQRYYGMTPDDRVLHNAGLAFDASMAETYPTLAIGACLMPCVDDEVRMVPANLLRWMAEQGVTLAFLTTQLGEAVLAERYPSDLRLRVLYTGGDKLHRGARLDAPFDLVNIYGPTECTVNVAMVTVPRGQETPPPIGSPVPNTQLYILDGAMRPVPIGVFGELYIAGDQVGRGYFKRPELTKERFVPNPFSDDPEEHMYRTGDLTRWLPDGNIEFFGRIDGQVKIRGFRIELGGIEAVLYTREEVREVVVVAREDTPGQKRLVAYVVPHEGARADVAELRRFVKEKLPEFMVPSAFVVLKALPLTQNGKVDRRRLPAPSTEHSTVVKPRNAPEAALHDMFCEVLGCESCSVDSSFFDLGGHSLSAARLVTRIQARFGVPFPLSRLFETPTIAALAEALVALAPFAFDESASAASGGADAMGPGASDAGGLDGGAADTAPGLHKDWDVLDGLPDGRLALAPGGFKDDDLSFAQRSLWFVSNGDDDWASRAYNIAFCGRLGSDVNVAWLRLALQAMFRRHEALRTCFPSMDGGERVCAQVMPEAELTLEEVEFPEELDAAARKSRLLDLTYQRFDLATGPVFRAYLIRHGTDLILLIVAHHIAVDLWSYVVMFDEVRALYAHLACGSDDSADALDAVLPPLDWQYRDYARAQHRLLGTVRGDQMFEYWKGVLRPPVPVLSLPTDRPRPAAQTFRGSSLLFDVPPEVLGKVRGLARSNGTTVYCVLLAAFQAYLSRLCDQDDFVVGTPMACRTSRAAEMLAGYTVNPVCIRAHLSGDPQFKNVLRRVIKSVVEAFEHQEMPFPLLVQRLHKERDSSRSPFFDVMFVLQKPHRLEDAGELARYFMGEDGIRLDLGNGLEMESVGLGHRHAQFDLTLMMAEGRNSMSGSFHYNTALFDSHSIQRMADNFLCLLAAAVAEPKQKLSALPFMTDGQVHDVTAGYNSAELPESATVCLHELFEAQAASHPAAPAVVLGGLGVEAGAAGGDTMTYGELNARANQLANYLRFLGVRRDQPVPVFLLRSTRLYVAWLGILKAGGAVMPLDPSFPRELLADILDGASARVVLSERSLRSRLPGTRARVLLLDADAERISEGSTEDTPSLSRPEDLAYVIHTAGSTGRPKGVMLEHQQVVASVINHIHLFGLGEADRVFGAANVAFDAAMSETWPPLCVGAALVPCADEDVVASPRATLRFWVRHGVTVAFAVTDFAEKLMALPAPPELQLRLLYTGGEALHRGPAEGTTYRVVNAYGPTETAMFIASFEVPQGWEGVAPIGAPVPGTQLYVLNSDRRPVPVGVYGELYVAGWQVARGYFNNDERTATAFLSNPFSSDERSRLYRTGDIVRWCAPGQLEFLSRAELQVKIRGFRVETSAVESVIKTHPAVTYAVVVARDNADRRRMLVAYVVLNAKAASGGAGTGAPAEADLQEYVRGQLPEFMVPSAVVILDKMPLTPRGKVEISALPDPELRTATRGAAAAAPKGDTAEKISALFCEILGLDAAAADTNFFDAGGHSLSAARLVSRIRRDFGLSFPLARLFETPTVAAVAKVVDVLYHRTAGAASVGRAKTTTDGGSANAGSVPAGAGPASSVGTSSLPTGSAGATASSFVVASRVLPSASDAPRSSPTDGGDRGQMGGLSSVSGSYVARGTHLSRWRSETQGSADSGSEVKGSVGASPSPYASPNTMAGSVQHRNALILGRGRSQTRETTGASLEHSTLSSADGHFIEGDATIADLSFNQRSLWFLHKLQPNRVDYTVFFALVIDDAAHVDTLKRTVEALMMRHDSLRTTYTEIDGVPKQVVHGTLPGVPAQRGLIIDYVGSGDACEQAFRDRIQVELHRPFDLRRGPVCRWHLLQRSDAESPSCLLFTANHIALDGWSVDVLLHDFGELLAMATGSPAKPLDPVATTAVDYARWQADMMASADGERMWTFWQRELAGNLPVLNLPTDRPRPAIQGVVGGSVPFKLDAELSAAVRALARSEHVTPFMLFMAAYQTVLHRYSGQSDILVGSPMACRTTEEVHNLVAQITNPVVMRARFEPGLTFASFLQRVRRTALDVFAHQEFPFPLLVERLVRFRDTSRAPIFQVLLSLNTRFRGDSDGATVADAADGSGFKLGGLSMKHLAVEQQVSPFDLQWIITDGGAAFSCELQYATSLFDRDTVSRMSRHIVTLLRAAVARPSTLLSELPLMPEDEARQTLVEWNATSAPFPRDKCIHEVFEEVVARSPAATALVDGTSSLSYHELNMRANQLAWYLRWKGVCEGNIVGLLFQRSAEYVIAMIAVLKAGAAFVPIDPAYPVERLRYMMDDTRMQVLLTQQQYLPRVKEAWRLKPDEILEDRPAYGADDASLESDGSAGEARDAGVSSELRHSKSEVLQSGPRGAAGGIARSSSSMRARRDGGERVSPVGEASPTEDPAGRYRRAPVVCVDSDWPSIVWAAGDGSDENLPCATQPRSLCYVIYTSGSTGKPKGVMVEHRGLVNVAFWHHRCYGVTADDRASQFVAPAFDPVQLEVWPFLTAGASLAIVPEAIRTSPEELRRWIRNFRITVCLLPTPVAEVFLLDGAGAGEPWPPRLRVLYTGGDKLHPPPLKTMPFRLDNHYGPSEATILSSYFTVELNGKAPPIGKPIDNAQLYVLDPVTRQPAPIGVPGELYIGGDGLARGYLYREDITRERFFPAPDHLPCAGRRLYKTGDLVRWLPSGDIEFMGRIDFQVKIRGFRIELGEIEAALGAHPSIRECAVVVKEPRPGDKRLVAYYVMRGKVAAAGAEKPGDAVGAKRGGSKVSATTSPNASSPIAIATSPPASAPQAPTLARLRSETEGEHLTPEMAASMSLREHRLHGSFQQESDGGIVAASAPPARAAPARETSVDELKAFLKDQLPEYMVPAAWILMDALPMTANGKIDRNALPEVTQAQWSGGGAAGAGTEVQPPRTRTETLLVSIFADALSLEKVGIHDNFFDVGGHSLAATKLVSQIRAKTGVDLPVAKLFEGPTVAAIAAVLDEMRGETTDSGAARAAAGGAGGGAEAAAYHTSAGVDVSKELQLPEDVRPPKTPAHWPTDPRIVFLTGATGFVGSFLLMELLTRTNATVHCLVRAADTATGFGRLRGRLTALRLWGDVAAHCVSAGRVKVVLGDLKKPRLGLSAAEFAELGGTVDSVYHAGAWVHGVLPYSSLKDSNVGGTVEVMRMACTRGVPVHFISTLSVFPARPGTVTEDNPMPESDFAMLGEGYAQSKWVADKLVQAAAGRGLPVTIIRLGRVTGHSTTGVASVEDVMCRLVKGCEQLGSAPIDLFWPVDMNPADLVASLSLLISLDPGSRGRAFHVVHPKPASLPSLFEWMRSTGYKLEAEEYTAWRERLMRVVGSPDGASNALYPLVALFDSGASNMTAEMLPHFDAANVEALRLRNPQFPPLEAELHRLADGSQWSTPPPTLEHPAIGPEMYETCFRFFVESGFLRSANDDHDELFDMDMDG